MKPKVLYKKAKEYQNTEKCNPEAIECYECIINKYPNSRYATLAYRELNEINSIKDRKDLSPQNSVSVLESFEDFVGGFLRWGIIIGAILFLLVLLIPAGAIHGS